MHSAFKIQRGMKYFYPSRKRKKRDLLDSIYKVPFILAIIQARLLIFEAVKYAGKIDIPFLLDAISCGTLSAVPGINEWPPNGISEL